MICLGLSTSGARARDGVCSLSVTHRSGQSTREKTEKILFTGKNVKRWANKSNDRRERQKQQTDTGTGTHEGGDEADEKEIH